MIPRDYITAWRAKVPWVQDFQVEQDLIISRALIAIYSHPLLAETLAFRGGTALYKLYLKPPARYSEDIDLVQVSAGPAGALMSALRETLDSWLGAPQWKQSQGRVTFLYRFDSEDTPPLRMRLKVEINTREHFSVYGFSSIPFEISSRWFAGKANIKTYELDELLATKCRALYQRRKGRDLFDLALALDHPAANPGRIATAFVRYLDHGGQFVSRVALEGNLKSKLSDPQFIADIGPLLASDFAWDPEAAVDKVGSRLVALLSGDQ